ncbi:hypothetical protein [Qipengyuania sp. Mu-71]|jgi:hypothetical protein|uniref:hypothetical protein n=1 Tax=Qipengyuania sp. Mu-71 TaxID=3121477 RepID=UPI002FE43C47
MFSKFSYEQLPLASIDLDSQNPRLVGDADFTSETEIVDYLFEHEALADLISKIVAEGKNRGAEQPYVIKAKSKNRYIVIEGNRRVASYKLLTGELTAPAEYADKVPDISDEFADTLRVVDVTIAPSRSSLDKIVARAHFGRGEKERWKYLGNRQAIYKRWKDGEKLLSLSRTFEISKSDVRDYLIEYLIYLEALKLDWTPSEREKLTDPKLQFNPPIRFLQTSGHRSAIGMTIDRTNVSVDFKDSESKSKFKHLIWKMLLDEDANVKATSDWDAVFSDYQSNDEAGEEEGGQSSDSGNEASDENGQDKEGDDPSEDSKSKYSPKKYALFEYDVTIKSGLLEQLMYEAGRLSANSYPASATSLLRSVVEALLKHIIDENDANKNDVQLSLEKSLDLCLSNAVQLSKPDKKILKNFKKDHLDYLNLGVHGNVIPHRDRTLAARNSIDPFVKKHI